MPAFSILILALGVPVAVPRPSICWTRTNPSTTSPAGDINDHFIQEPKIGEHTQDDVRAIEPRGGGDGDKELGAVGVLADVSHRQEMGLVVLQLEVLVGKPLTVDGLSASAVSTGEVATLEHKL